MLSGFKNFLLRGNLIELAVAVIIGASFASVVSTFTNWLTAQLPSAASDYFENTENSFGAFMNAVIAFVILAAVVYFLIVMPYTKAKERYFPSAPPGTPEDIKILQEIRDLIAAQQGTVPPTDGPGLTK
jgi:large conductance mechanosensitive channel